MFKFITTAPTAQTLRHHFNRDHDRTIAALIENARPVIANGWDIGDYFHDIHANSFLHVQEGSPADLLFAWIADHLYGGGDISIDPAWMVQVLDKLDTPGTMPDLDAMMSMVMWARWRRMYLRALLKNQERGQPLGTAKETPHEARNATAFEPLRLHIVTGTPSRRCPKHLKATLDTLLARVRADVASPTWVLHDVAALYSDLSEHYFNWMDWLLTHGVDLDFDTASFTRAITALAQPAAPLPGYAGPLYKYGVDFEAGSFLVAQALALDFFCPN